MTDILENEAPEVVAPSEVPAAPEVAQPKSLRDQISDALEAQREQTGNDAGLEADRAAQKARDEKGRFAGKGEAPADVPAAPATPEQPAEQAKAPDALKAPATWTPAEREQWAALPEWARTAVMRREREAAQALTRQDEDRMMGKHIKDVVTPYKAFIPQGQSEVQVVQSLLASHAKMAMASPAEKTRLLFQLAQSYGADLTQLAPQAPAAEVPQYEQAPGIQALVQEVENLKGMLQQRNEDDQQANATAVQSQVEAFASDPKNEFFADVRSVMSQLIQSGVAADLADAYKQAIWAHGPTREVMIQRENKARIEQAAKAAETARRAGSSVIGGPGRTKVAGAAKPTGRLSTLEAVANELMPD